MGNEDVDRFGQVRHNTAAQNDVKIIDWEMLIKLMVYDEELVKEVVDVWLKEISFRIVVLEEAIKAKEEKQISLHAHTIKGSSATISANDLTQVALQLEMASKEGNMEICEAIFVNVKTEFNRVKSFLSQANWVEIAKTQCETQGGVV